MKKVLFIFIFIISFACVDTKQTDIKANYPIIKVDLDKCDKVSISNLFSKVELIPLETNNNCLIKRIEKIMFVKNNIYILDQDQAILFVFDNGGEYKFKIDKKGNGPDEYVSAYDFIIDEVTHQIIILDTFKSTLLIYDENGNFQKKVKLPNCNGAYSNMQKLNSDTIAFWTFDYENRIKYYSLKSQKIVWEAFPEKKGALFGTMVLSNKCFYRDLSNKRYSLENNEIGVAYQWDFGKYNNDDKSLSVLYEIKDEQQYVDNVVNSINTNYLFTNQLNNVSIYYASIVRKSKLIELLYDCRKNKAYIFSKTVEGFYLNFITMTDKFAISYINEYDDNIFKIIPDSEKVKLDSHKDDDNPVLIKYYF